MRSSAGYVSQSKNNGTKTEKGSILQILRIIDVCCMQTGTHANAIVCANTSVQRDFLDLFFCWFINTFFGTVSICVQQTRQLYKLEVIHVMFRKSLFFVLIYNLNKYKGITTVVLHVQIMHFMMRCQKKTAWATLLWPLGFYGERSW